MKKQRMRGGTGETLLGIYYELLRKAFEGECFTVYFPDPSQK
jgi:hypothetical protein